MKLFYMFKRVGYIITILILVIAGVSFGNNQWRSYLRNSEYEKNVHEDESTFTSGVRKNIGDDAVELFIKTEQQFFERRLVDQETIENFVETQLVKIEHDRLSAKEAATNDAILVMKLVFADAPDRVSDYADWFYQWKRSYILLKETILSSAHRTVSSGVEDWKKAVERDITDYFMRHFVEQVLQPETRDPLVKDGVLNALQHANERYAQTLVANDLQLQLFLQEHTTHLDTDQLSETTEVDLDWDSQKWKAPLRLIEDKAFDGAMGVGLMATGAAGGRVAGRVLAPSFARLVRQSFAKMAARTTTQLVRGASTTAAGASAGSAVPVIGSAFGAAFGLALGATLDYLGNKADRWLNREEFIVENMRAVSTIERHWTASLEQELHRTIDTWYDDAELLLQGLRPSAEQMVHQQGG